MTTDVLVMLKTAVAARRDSLAALRARISAILEPVPYGVVLSDDTGEVCRVVPVVAGASQWTNRSWCVTIRGAGYMAPSGRLVAEAVDDSMHDGSNLHYRRTGTYLPGDECGEPLGRTTGAETRALAARLPAALARYLAECESERAANDATAPAAEVRP